MIYILFTRSNKLGSKLIRKVTGESISHCALMCNGYVLHSTLLKGVHLVPYKQFKDENEIVHILSPSYSAAYFIERIYKYIGKKYDYIAFIGLGLRYLLGPIMPKINVWNISNMYICTELFKTDRLLTPEQLYKELLK